MIQGSFGETEVRVRLQTGYQQVRFQVWYSCPNWLRCKACKVRERRAPRHGLYVADVLVERSPHTGVAVCGHQQTRGPSSFFSKTPPPQRRNHDTTSSPRGSWPIGRPATSPTLLGPTFHPHGVTDSILSEWPSSSSENEPVFTSLDVCDTREQTELPCDAWLPERPVTPGTPQDFIF